MTQSAPAFVRRVPTLRIIATSLGLRSDDMVDGEDAEVVSTGVPHLLVPVASRAAVDRAQPDTARLLELLAASGAEGCYLYTRVGDTDAYARFFNPTVGIAEDPATGTAAGPLAALLVRDGHALDSGRVTVEQGRVLSRPSRIEVSIAGDVVRISGSGVVAAEGVLHL
jgi:PhzF family phenazine biosynthesis protein